MRIGHENILVQHCKIKVRLNVISDSAASICRYYKLAAFCTL